MNNLKNKYIVGHEKIYVLFVFVIGWMLLALQHSNVGMYYDDFGNAALAYGYKVEDVIGTNFTIMDILEWAKWIYLNWGGRLLYACVILIPMLKNGIGLYMFMQSIVIALILYTIYRIACKIRQEDTSIGMAILVFILYGLIGREIHSNGTYWASASILYVWSLLPTLLAIFFFSDICSKIKKNESVKFFWFYIVESVSIIFATQSQEQIGGSLIVFFCIYILLHHIKDFKKYLKVDIFVMILSIISYTVLFVAPGNYVRLSTCGEFTTFSLVKKISYNLPIITKMFVSHDFHIFNQLFIIANVFAVIMILKINFKNIINILLTITTIVTSLIYMYGLNNDYWMYGILIFLLNMALVAWRYFYLKHKPEFMAYFMAAASSVFCLIVSPGIMPRCYIEYVLFTFAYIMILYLDFYKNICTRQVFKYVFIIFILFIGFKSYLNFQSVYEGYHENKFYEDYNYNKLRNWNNTQETVVTLLKFPNSEYKGVESYEINYDGWIREYYDIPENVQFKWIDFRESNVLIEYQAGFYDVENNDTYKGRWSDQVGEISIYNFTMEPLNIGISTIASTGYEENSKLSIILDDQRFEYQISSEQKSITCELILKPGKNIVTFSTDAKQVDAKDDPRNLFFRLLNTKVEFNLEDFIQN